MKKALKIAAIVIGSLALVIGGYVLYIAKFKEYDVADTQVDEIVREPYVIELPDGGTLEIEEDGTVTEKDADGNVITVTEAPESAEDTVVAASNSSSTDTQSSGTDSTQTGTTNSGGGSTGSSGTGGSGSSNDGASGSGSSGNGSGSGSTGGSGSGGGSNAGSGSGSGSSGSESGGSTNQPQTMTVAQIKEKYNPVFASLEAQAEGRLNSLISRAKAEYSEKQASGEVDYGYFYRKYSSAAANLEASTDAAFYSTLAVVQNVFVANGFNKSYAADYETQYKQRKADRRSELMSKVTGG